jgi:hypothetical protein
MLRCACALHVARRSYFACCMLHWVRTLHVALRAYVLCMLHLYAWDTCPLRSERLAELKAEGCAVCVMEAAVLLEARWDDVCDEVPCRAAPPRPHPSPRRAGVNLGTALRCSHGTAERLRGGPQGVAKHAGGARHAACTRGNPARGTCQPVKLSTCQSVNLSICQPVSAPRSGRGSGVDGEHGTAARAAAADGAEPAGRGRSKRAHRLAGPGRPTSCHAAAHAMRAARWRRGHGCAARTC